MTTSTSGEQPVPDRDHRFEVGDKLYVIREVRFGVHKVGDVVTVDRGDPADADDEISIVHGYIRRDCVSLVPPPPLDAPPSLRPDDLERWLSS